MRTVYLGHNPGYVLACHKGTQLAAVFWHGSTGNIAKRTKLMLEYCRQNKIVTVHHLKLNDVIKRMITSLKPDLIVVGEYHFLLKREFIDIPRYGAINMHGAPLPRYRGAHPINWMIINGETKGAVTCHYITEGLDNGDIIGQNNFLILETETAYDVRPKIEAKGQQLLIDVLRRFTAEGKVVGIPQDESKALYTPPRKPEDGLIDWDMPPKQVYDFVRALTRPYPGAFAWLDGKKVYLWRSELPSEENISSSDYVTPGTILEKWKGGFKVAVSSGTVNVIDWKTDGRNIEINDRLIGKST